MTGKRLLKRILLVMAGAFAFLLIAAVVQSQAVPIRPDLKKLLAQPPEDAAQLPLARAGWDGPETRTQVEPNPTLERLGPAGTARLVRASLVSAAIPDYRVLAAILLVILLLRRIRQAQRKSQSDAAKVLPLAPGAASENSEDTDKTNANAA